MSHEEKCVAELMYKVSIHSRTYKTSFRVPLLLPSVALARLSISFGTNRTLDHCALVLLFEFLKLVVEPF